MQRIKNIYKNPFFSGTMLMVVGSMSANALNYLYHLAMGKLLDPIGYGTLASIFSVLYIVSVVPLSSSVAIVKFISSAKDKKETSIVFSAIQKFVWKIALYGFLSLALLSPFIAKFLHINEVFAVFMASPILFFSLVSLVNQSTSQGKLKFMGVVGPNFVASIVKLFLGALLVVVGFSVTGAILGVLVGIVLAYFYSKRFVSDISITKKEYDLKPFIKYSLPALLQALAFTSFFTTDLILVKHFLSPQDAGIYAALSTLGKIIFFASSPVTSVMFPIVSKRKAAGESYLKVGVASFLLNAAISLSVLFLYGFLPDFTIKLLYDQRYIAPAGSLFLMGLFISIYTSAHLLVNYLLSIGRVKVVILPLIGGLLQIFGIIVWHNSIIQTIYVSLFTISFVFLGVVLFLFWENKSLMYVKK